MLAQSKQQSQRYLSFWNLQQKLFCKVPGAPRGNFLLRLHAGFSGIQAIHLIFDSLLFLYHCSSSSVCSLAFISWPTLLSVKKALKPQRHLLSERKKGAWVNLNAVWMGGGNYQKQRKEAASSQNGSEKWYNLWETAHKCRISLIPPDFGPTCSLKKKRERERERPWKKKVFQTME